jgi:Zn-ribbon RNA-binding protein
LEQNLFKFKANPRKKVKLMEDLKCISCKTKITNQHGAARFMCPKCGEYEIIRCTNCRKTVAKYTCPKCGFTGPN